MRKEIREVNEENQIIQITTPDERWYGRLNKKDEREFVPSVTWIASYYPKGKGFEIWLANKGMDEAEMIKKEAGQRGSRVHKAIELLVSGLPVRIDQKFENPDTGVSEELTADEYEAIISFANWWKTLKDPKLIASEEVVWNEKYNYAGTVDLVLEIDGEWWIVDIKTSQNIYPSHKIQLSAYKNSDEYKQSKPRIGILQVGYSRNKNKYKFTELIDQFELFLSARNIWEEETRGVEPLQREFPLEIKL